MKPLSSELKSVTVKTVFNAVRVFDDGMERHALIDQDRQIVGLVDSDRPYFINGTFSDACRAAETSLQDGAIYKSYSCSPFGVRHYVINKTLDPITTFSDIPAVRKSEELANQAIGLSQRLNATNLSDVPTLPNEKIIN